MSDLSKVAIVLTAHPRQQKWWATVLLSLEGFPGALILAYDDIDLDPLPASILERFTIAQPTGYASGTLGHGRGELVCMRIGFLAAAELGAEYVLKLGFDEPVWRWRNIARMLEQIHTEDLDSIDCQTRVIVGRTAKLVEVMTRHDVVARGPGSAESYYDKTSHAVGLARRYIRDRPWWERELGLCHLQGEYAANLGHNNKWSWSIGEVWPRGE